MIFQQIQREFPHACVGENCAVCRWVRLHVSIRPPAAPVKRLDDEPLLRGKDYRLDR